VLQARIVLRCSRDGDVVRVARVYSHWGGREALAAIPGTGSALKAIIKASAISPRTDPRVRLNQCGSDARFRSHRLTEKYDINPRTINASVRRSFLAAGWEPEPYTSPLTTKAGHGRPPGLRADFKLGRVFVEVQFGSANSAYADYFKFLCAFTRKTLDVGVLIVPMKGLSRRMGENVIWLNKVTRELPLVATALRVPIFVMGVDDDVAVHGLGRPEDEGLARAREARESVLAETCERMGRDGRRGSTQGYKRSAPDRSAVHGEHPLLPHANQEREEPRPEAR